MFSKEQQTMLELLKDLQLKLPRTCVSKYEETGLQIVILINESKFKYVYNFKRCSVEHCNIPTLTNYIIADFTHKLLIFIKGGD